MSEPDNFLSRWARRKSEVQAPSPTESMTAPQADGKPGDGSDVASADPESLDPDSIDLDSLPSIESITAATDISGFLRSGVPAELARSALRQAWARDPAIRDFIGIAENQWDFNDPTAITGFGPMSGTDDMAALLRQALGRVKEIGEAMPDIAPTPQPTAEVAVRAQPMEPASDHTASVDPVTAAAPARPDDAVATSDTIAALGGDDRLHGRRHGSALPR